MLVLSRRLDEEIIIGGPENPIVIKLLDISGKHIRLGIEAPKETEIRRGELPSDSKRKKAG